MECRDKFHDVIDPSRLTEHNVIWSIKRDNGLCARSFPQSSDAYSVLL